jgi:HEAT repeat protein
MKLSKTLVALTVLGGIVAGFAGWYFSSLGPRYKGEPLDYWSYQLSMGTRSEQQEARTAILAMGVSAVPSLIDAVKHKDPPIQRFLQTYGARMPSFQVASAAKMVSPFYYAPGSNPRHFAARALGELGRTASNAVPALMEAAKHPELGAAATAALIRIRGEPIAPLVQSLRDFRSPRWIESAHIAGYLGLDAAPAVPGLCQALQSTNELVVSAAANALGRIHLESALAVPALLEALVRFDNQKYFRLSLYDALGSYEADARAAVPAIRHLLASSADPDTRAYAGRLLCRILPPTEIMPSELKPLVTSLMVVATDPRANPNERAAARKLLWRFAPAEAAKASLDF